jgi:hypothetical protein
MYMIVNVLFVAVRLLPTVTASMAVSLAPNLFDQELCAKRQKEKRTAALRLGQGLAIHGVINSC